jgi:hypothetical protein
MRYILGFCLLASTICFSAEFNEPVCEHRVVVEYRLVKEDWLEIVDVAEQIGQITAEHASSLRAIVEEAYSMPKAELPAWVAKNCNPKQ